MKRVYNGYTKTITLEMDYEDYLKLMFAITYEAEIAEHSPYKKEFQQLERKIKESDYESIV